MRVVAAGIVALVLHTSSVVVASVNIVDSTPPSDFACRVAFDDMIAIEFYAFNLNERSQFGSSENSDAEWAKERNDAGKGFNKANVDLKKCANPKERNRIRAYGDTYSAIIYHATGVPWQTPLNLANQLLERCVTDFYGDKRGAECETQLDANVKNKVHWEASPDSQ